MVKTNCKNIEKLIFRYVNQTRKKNNLCELKPDRGLIFLARKHSSLMAKKKEDLAWKKCFCRKELCFNFYLEGFKIYSLSFSYFLSTIIMDYFLFW